MRAGALRRGRFAGLPLAWTLHKPRVARRSTKADGRASARGVHVRHSPVLVVRDPRELQTSVDPARFRGSCRTEQQGGSDRLMRHAGVSEQRLHDFTRLHRASRPQVYLCHDARQPPHYPRGGSLRPCHLVPNT